MRTLVEQVRELTMLPDVIRVSGVESEPPGMEPDGFNVTFEGQSAESPNTAIISISMPNDQAIGSCSATDPRSNAGVIEIGDGRSDGTATVAVDLNVPITSEWGHFELNIFIGDVTGDQAERKYKYYFRKTGVEPGSPEKKEDLKATEIVATSEILDDRPETVEVLAELVSVDPDDPPDDVNVTFLGHLDGAPDKAVFKIEKPKERKLKHPEVNGNVAHQVDIDSSGRIINRDEHHFIWVQTNKDISAPRWELTIKVVVAGGGRGYKYRFTKSRFNP